jgi:hypothetical protein
MLVKMKLAYSRRKAMLRAKPKPRPKVRDRQQGLARKYSAQTLPESNLVGKRLRHPLLKPDVMGPKGPYGKYFEIKVTPQKFDLLKQFNFVRIIAGSVDFALDYELLLKDIDTFLCIVPKYIPAVLLIMENAEFDEKMNSLTVFRLSDGKRTRDYLLAHMADRK